MLKTTSVALLLLSPSWGTHALMSAVQSDSVQSSPTASGSPVLPSIKYCVLVERSSRYWNRLVRMTAMWQFGFETSRLFDRECLKQPGAWLEFADDNDACPETKKNRDIPGPHDKEAQVTVTGRLVGPGRFGHLGAYQYKFVVTCLEKIKITSSDLK